MKTKKMITVMAMTTAAMVMAVPAGAETLTMNAGGNEDTYESAGAVDKTFEEVLAGYSEAFGGNSLACALDVGFDASADLSQMPELAMFIPDSSVSGKVMGYAEINKDKAHIVASGNMKIMGEESDMVTEIYQFENLAGDTVEAMRSQDSETGEWSEWELAYGGMAFLSETESEPMPEEVKQYFSLLPEIYKNADDGAEYYVLKGEIDLNNLEQYSEVADTAGIDMSMADLIQCEAEGNPTIYIMVNKADMSTGNVYACVPDIHATMDGSALGGEGTVTGEVKDTYAVISMYPADVTVNIPEAVSAYADSMSGDESYDFSFNAFDDEVA